MNKIIGLHGIVTNGKYNIGKLLQIISNQTGYKTYHPKYRIFPTLGYFNSYREFYIDKALENFNDGDHFIAHSAGCMITYLALQKLKKQGKKAGKIFFMNAALDRRIIFPENTYDTIVNFIEDDDFVLKLAYFLPWHPFGEMGRLGYRGPSENVVNKENIAKFKYSFLYHGSYVKEPAMSKLVEIIKHELFETN